MGILIHNTHSVFQGKPQVAQYFNTVKNFMETLFYRARRLFKNLNEISDGPSREARKGVPLLA